ncbi:N-acetylglucosamine-6-phosphate deacetylase [Neolamprologus brichardi]|uniref:N-acetylglucosamine-6-phosphate deacetylase n=1 Tax=Neolamprologus brichardi TaxID=32507 RepID=UPI001643EE3C|nr:N-acetylglucosamine-6-phosphate deacetylase [Neolamprologus brichardi]
MPSNKSVSDAPITQFINCRILRDNELQRYDTHTQQHLCAVLAWASFARLVLAGHSAADLSQAEEAVQHGASFITHLFNAMLPFHHRDPGIVGLLTSDRIPAGRAVYYGMIADGIHTNPAALRIAHRAHPSGLVLVTDAITAMGLPPGRHTLGQQVIEIQGLHAYVAGTKTLSGSIATMDMCVRHFKQASGCSVQEALEAASLHPAQLLGISPKKGKLDYGSDAGQSRLHLCFCIPAVRAAVGPPLCPQRFLGC